MTTQSPVAGALRLQLTAAAVGVFFLAVLSIGSSLAIGHAARDDAAAINLAGSLRMQAFRIALIDHLETDPSVFREGVAQFGQTLAMPALHRVVELDQTPDLRRQFDAVQRWHRHLSALAEGSAPQLRLQYLPRDLLGMDVVVERIDAMVSALQTQAESRLEVLRLMQWSSLVIAMLLFGVVIRQLSVGLVWPIGRLMAGIDRLANGERLQPIANLPRNEIGRLGEHFNHMAASLTALQRDLEAEVEAKTEALRRMNEALALQSEEQQVRVLAQERAIIARELHDSIAQSLAYLKIQVVRLRAQMATVKGMREELDEILDELRDGLNTAYQDLRGLLTTYRLQVNQSDLRSALEATVAEFSRRDSGLKIQLTFKAEAAGLGANEKVHLVYIVREALANVLNHANATRVWVAVVEQRNPAMLALTIEDDGIGFAPDSQRVEQGHFGLGIMRERAWQLGGSWQLDCGDQGGTRIEVGVPLS